METMKKKYVVTIEVYGITEVVAGVLCICPFLEARVSGRKASK